MLVDPPCLVLLMSGLLIPEFSFQRRDVDDVFMVHITES